MSKTYYEIARGKNDEIRHCENCQSIVATHLFQNLFNSGEQIRLCEICSSTHLSRSRGGTEPSNDDIAKGLAWCVNLLRTEIAQLRAEIAEMKNTKP